MKRKGFTLAEVLISLAIIGVVAALTMPNLTTDVQAAKIGPKLGKAASMFEQANEALLNDEGVDVITDTEYSATEYSAALCKHIKATDTGGGLHSKDGVDYTLAFYDKPSGGDAPHQKRIGNVVIDINGTDIGPNTSATDLFYFELYDDGSLRPKGGVAWAGSSTDKTWKDNCKKGVVPSDPDFCAGHIFENNMKVLYK